MRLDLYLTKNFNIQSRNKANELIKASKVKVDNKIISKASFIVEENMNIELLEEDFYVSRAAYKLKYFLDEIKIDLQDKIALDIGSSTGGFTQILLEHQIKKVICVDVGSNQLHERIKNDERIEFFENCDIRDFKSEICFDIVTCDVSFISILNIINSIDSLDFKKLIILFKPQFEVGINVKRDKKGVVKDKDAIEKARSNFLAKTLELKWKLEKNNISKLQGKDGNYEEFFYFSK
ncbi:23S rRNA (cytidine-2'-O)-methyltransferase TlyA [Aliarcobacter cibarius]|jgi:23S rRNA (cytidine1920-2'-O)/16S rRNA (cytidine1409-2'-O)-methyltransferase|uniref:16S/23S rRNA (Cytidine-2'-O)-methyltransferase n=1 Tax=Aliarcobacter cibarius TaxID=255507 RepID=A0A7L5JN84_9BACT|nr:TlyA family RNA methyltransferase [Aliarcobacter cibarius]QKJ26627.1 16S/23S rRNA (cytidine-2'-O)-methyltransferase [Aliarcobacter cibarius]TLS95235.1 TlyA family RNA methyltransferase [Aliarcobacter cibarius]TLS95715.1 TlyA family RNA methyltransferase [Aliarcobacter cibarius]TLT02449.1 TlyA family RNA methyltransferase [Aliarcobacter cibarius]